MEEHSIQVALLNEARQVPGELKARYSESGTTGRDTNRIGRPITRRFSTAIVSAGGEWETVQARAVGRSGRRPNIPFGPSRAGSWTAGMVDAPEIGCRVTCVALYGLIEELTDASMHRSLSEIGPIFTDPNYKDHVLVGGDFNTTTAWPEHEYRVRDQGVLERFEAYGLVDCLRMVRKPGRLKGCTCVFGEDCRHTWTRRDPNHPKVPLQMDYLFASRALAGRLKACEALSPLEFQEHSDHSPIIATFE